VWKIESSTLSGGRDVFVRAVIGDVRMVIRTAVGILAKHNRRIVGHDIGPLERKPGEVSRVVVEIDAVLAPRLTAID
jgi:hypothetical protein